MVEKVGIVGLGVMGTAMSHHLLEAGYEVHGYDVESSRIDDLVNRGGTGAASGADVARASDVVLLSLPSIEALESASRDVAMGAHDGLIAVEMGTLPVPVKQAARDRLAEVGVELMDVPVSGTGLQAADGTLVVMASGSEEAFGATKPIFDAIGRATYHLGPFPNGSIMKFIANLLVSVHTLAAAEAHTLGLAAGMDPNVVQEVIADGVGRSAMFEIRGPMMVADTYDPPSARLDIIKKDAGIIQDYARSVGAVTPLLDAALPLYRSASEGGLGGLDAAALCRHLSQLAGIERS
jgi:3-hydroxyisobutyrate dehydrogenase-like beta-hydroxyacid dehydrogenase